MAAACNVARDSAAGAWNLEAKSGRRSTADAKDTLVTSPESAAISGSSRRLSTTSDALSTTISGRL
jgi:hypothetical protein